MQASAEGDPIDAIKAVSAGKAFFSPEIGKVLVEGYVRQIRRRGVEDPGAQPELFREGYGGRRLAEGRGLGGAARVVAILW